jgi:hypothetical protein
MSSRLATFLGRLAKSVGPALAGFTSIAQSILQVLSALAKIGIGGQGMIVLADTVRLAANIISSALVVGVIEGIVMVDRALLTAVSGILRFVDALLSIVLNAPGVGTVAKLLMGSFFAISGAVWITQVAMNSWLTTVWASIAATATWAGEQLFFLGVWVTTQLGMSAASVAANAIIGATVVGAVLLLGVAIVELALHWKTAWAWIKSALSSAAKWIESTMKWLAPVLLLLIPPLGLVVEAILHISSILSGLRSAWHAVFGSGHAKTIKQQETSVRGLASQLIRSRTATNSLNNGTQKLTHTTSEFSKTMNAQLAKMRANSNAANQFKNAMNGLYPATGHVTKATGQLMLAEEQIGTQIAHTSTGFATFTKQVPQTYKQMVANLELQNTTMILNMYDTKVLIQRALQQGFSTKEAVKAIQTLATQMPQDLGTMVTMSTPHFDAIMNHFLNMEHTAGIAGSKTGFALVGKMMAGLESGNSQVRNWAQGVYNRLDHLKSQMPTLGQLIAAGLAQGMTTGALKADLAAMHLGQGIISVLNHTVQTRSPSRLTTQIGQYVADGLKQGMLGHQAGVQTAATSFGPLILGRFAKAGSWLVDIGKNIVKGLIDGIESMAQAAMNTIQSLANSLLGSIKSILGIASPSRVMMTVGTQIVQGLAQGITGATGLATGAMTGLGGSLLGSAQNMNRGMSMGGSGAFGGGINIQATFEINAPGGNATAIKDVISTDAAQAFAQQTLAALRAGAGTIY